MSRLAISSIVILLFLALSLADAAQDESNSDVRLKPLTEMSGPDRYQAKLLLEFFRSEPSAAPWFTTHNRRLGSETQCALQRLLLMAKPRSTDAVP